MTNNNNNNYKLKAVLFDIDGTLCDTDRYHVICWAELLKPYGYNVDHQFYNTQISGGGNSDLARKFFPNKTQQEQNQLMIDKESKTRELMSNGLEPLDGLIKLMDYLQYNNIKLAAVTNAPRINAYFMLDKIGVTNRFDHIVLADELCMYIQTNI